MYSHTLYYIQSYLTLVYSHALSFIAYIQSYLIYNQTFLPLARLYFQTPLFLKKLVIKRRTSQIKQDRNFSERLSNLQKETKEIPCLIKD